MTLLLLLIIIHILLSYPGYNNGTSDGEQRVAQAVGDGSAGSRANAGAFNIQKSHWLVGRGNEPYINHILVTYIPIWLLDFFWRGF